MPNYCMNNITITHKDPEMIRKAQESFAQEKFLETFVPVPEGLSDEEAYYWRTNNWGTKWDVGGDGVVEDPNTFSASFDSAWSPPVEAYQAMLQLGFTFVEATFFEPGMAFYGRFSGDPGTEGMVEEVSFDDPSELPEWVIDDFGICFDEEGMYC